jgi:hypothetical protein
VWQDVSSEYATPAALWTELTTVQQRVAERFKRRVRMRSILRRIQAAHPDGSGSGSGSSSSSSDGSDGPSTEAESDEGSSSSSAEPQPLAHRRGGRPGRTRGRNRPARGAPRSRVPDHAALAATTPTPAPPSSAADHGSGGPGGAPPTEGLVVGRAHDMGRLFR